MLNEIRYLIKETAVMSLILILLYHPILESYVLNKEKFRG